ncbi:basic proline-rich protein-like [Monodon monoceros]|nr:basic proline-rich protein-like [Monodon monoceros]
MTGRPRVTRCRTQRGLGYAPTSCRSAGSACRAGQEGGSHWDPPRAGKGQERGGARKECAEAPVYPGVGRAPQPCPDLLPPSGPGAPTPTPREAVGGHGAGRGACFEPSGAAWQARPVQVGLPTPAALRKLLPSSPHPLRGAQTPEPSRCPEPGDSQVGGQCREVPRPLRFPETPTGKLSHRQQPLPVTLAGRDPPQTPTPLRRNTRPRPTERGPQPPGTSPGASAAPDQVLPLFLEFMAGGSCQRSWHSSWAGKEQISTSARLLFPVREILMCDLSHLSPFPWKMSVSNFLHKPQTSSSHSHIKDENNLGNHPNAHQ